MDVYITDNPDIKKTIGGECFLAYQLYDWRYEEVVDKDDPTKITSNIVRRKKNAAISKSLKNNTGISAIIAPSNYKLIYDLLYMQKEFNKELKLYSWISFAKRKPIKINLPIVNKEFERYLQRGLLSRKEFDSLACYSFIRIEQFVCMLIIARLNVYVKTSPTLGLPANYQESPLKDNEVSLLGMIRVLMKEKGFFYKVIDTLTYHARRCNISDPFAGNFKFYNTENALFKFFTKYHDTDVYKGIDEQKFLLKYKAGVSYIITELLQFMPLTDVLKTLRYMETNGFIKTDGQGFDIFSPLQEDDMEYYERFYDPTIWQDLYRLNSYSFSAFFPKLRANLPIFRCPLCGGSELAESPLLFACGNAKCCFKLHRIISPAGKKKTLLEREVLQLVNFGFTHVKNRMGGYSKYILKRYNLKFRAVPEYQANTPIEDE